MVEIIIFIAAISISFYFLRKIQLRDSDEEVFTQETAKKQEKIMKKIEKEVKVEEAEPNEEEEKSVERLISDSHSAFEKGDFRDAEKLLIEAIKKDRKNPKAYFALGNVFFTEENLEDAVHAFKKATEYDPMNDQAFNNLGLAFYQLKDYRNALQSFEKSIAINPDVPHRFVNLALSATKAGDNKAAVKSLEQLTDLESEPSLKHLKMLAEAYERAGQNNDQAKVLTRILEIDPEDVDVKRKLAGFN